MSIYILMGILGVSNCVIFLCVQRNYKKVFQVVFYLLALVTIAARCTSIYYFLEDHTGTTVNLCPLGADRWNDVATYGKILLAWVFVT